MSAHVRRLAHAVWEGRASGRLTRDGRLLGQQMAVAAAADVAADEGYDPEEDRKIHWLREVAEKVRRGEPPVAEATLEALVDWMLHGPATVAACGKDLAAGTRTHNGG